MSMPGVPIAPWMTLSRPLLIALLAAFALLAASTAMRTLGTDGDGEVGTGAPAPAPKQAAARAERKPAVRAADRPRATPRRDGAPLPAVRAIAAGRPVVLVFHQDRAADDAAVHRAADALKGTRAKVFVEPVSRLARYRRLVGNLEIAQTPATVVVGRRLEATLLEGYVDAGSLRQFVADARR